MLEIISYGNIRRLNTDKMKRVISTRGQRARLLRWDDLNILFGNQSFLWRIYLSFMIIPTSLIANHKYLFFSLFYLFTFFIYDVLYIIG